MGSNEECSAAAGRAEAATALTNKNDKERKHRERESRGKLKRRSCNNIERVCFNSSVAVSAHGEAAAAAL